MNNTLLNFCSVCSNSELYPELKVNDKFKTKASYKYYLPKKDINNWQEVEVLPYTITIKEVKVSTTNYLTIRAEISDASWLKDNTTEPMIGLYHRKKGELVFLEKNAFEETKEDYQKGKDINKGSMLKCQFISNSTFEAEFHSYGGGFYTAEFEKCI